jgi:4-hydroxy-tetrahydrodipicolinate synthase
MTRTPVLHVPLITPLAADGAIDLRSLSALAEDVLASGPAGVVLFGTLGEAQSFSVSERMAGLDALLDAGIDPARIMVGTGAAALPDVVALSKHALAAGCVRQLLLPPFFFKGISDEGLHAFIAGSIEQTGDPRLRLTLYDIPGVVSVAIARDVISRLIDAYGSTIAAIKDSVPSWDHVEQSIRSFPQLDVFVGNEIFLPRALAIGGAGAISGLGNIAPRQMAAIVAAGADGEGASFERMCTLYDRIGRHPVVPAVKALTARARGDAGLARVRPPLMTFDLAEAADVTAAADAFLAGDA